MKYNKENAAKWLREAEYDLLRAGKLLADGDFALSCFCAEQSAQKSLKAYLFFAGERSVMIHSVGELAKKATAYRKEFGDLIDMGKKLDKHYLSSRYPDALPEPAIPSESYIYEEAEEAVKIAEAIIARVREAIK